MSDGFAALGAELQRCDGTSSGAGFTAIAEIGNIGGPELARGTADVTHLKSTAQWREKIATLRDGGSFGIQLNMTSAEYTLLLADYNNNTAVLYRIVLADAGAMQFDFVAFVTRLGMNADKEDAVRANAELEISGVVTLS